MMIAKPKSYLIRKWADHYSQEKNWIQTQEYIKEVRRRGLTISTSMVIVSGRGIVMNKDANKLSENGGGINLTKQNIY